MAGKRQATSDLNHDNWDKEEEHEDAGHFREANDDELRSRVIKKARRRIVEGSTVGASVNNGNTSNSIFSGFKGFGKAENSASKPSPFAFLTKIPPSGTSVSGISTKAATNTIIPAFSFGSATSGGSVSKTEKNSLDSTETKDENGYFSKILKLNQSFCAWIQKHVDEKPLCNLMPTFKDYEKYLNEIQKEQEQSGKLLPANVKSATQNIGQNFASPTNSSLSTVPATTLPAAPLFSATNSQAAGFGMTTNIKTTTKTSNLVEGDIEKKENNFKANGSEFSFGLKNAIKPNDNPLTSSGFMFGETKSNGNTTTTNTESTTTSKLFTFGSPLNTKPISNVPAASPFESTVSKPENKPPAVTPFSFGLKKDDALKSTTSGFSFASGSTPFTFGNIKPPVATSLKENEGNANEEDEDELPKEEIKEVVEDDALFTKKCKVFVKKDGTYKDYGLGTFFLKPVKDSTKTQLLVRSCNNLGTILVNVILAEGMPTQRMGKNNVMLVHPAAAGESKPQTTLFRVKDGAEADELFEVINKYKK